MDGRRSRGALREPSRGRGTDRGDTLARRGKCSQPSRPDLEHQLELTRHAHHRPGPALHLSAHAARARVYRRHRAHTGAWDRRQHRDLQRRRRPPVQTAPLPGSRAAVCHRAGEQRPRRHGDVAFSEVRRVRARAAGIRAHGSLREADDDDRSGRPADAGRSRSRDEPLLPPLRRASCTRTSVHR